VQPPVQEEDFMTKMATNLGDALAASEDRLAEMRIAHPLQSLDGLLSFVCGDNVTFKTELYRKLAEPDDWPKMIEEEWRTLLVSNSKMLPEFKARIEAGLDDLNYVINEPAGSNGRTFQNGWVRDRAADGSKLPDREGWRLQDFVKTNVAQKAGLQVGHILCLRLYSTSSYWFINFPLRRTKQEGNTVKLMEPHPLRLTLAVMQEAVEKLRKVSAADRFGLDMDDSTVKEEQSVSARPQKASNTDTSGKLPSPRATGQPESSPRRTSQPESERRTKAESERALLDKPAGPGILGALLRWKSSGGSRTDAGGGAKPAEESSGLKAKATTSNAGAEYTYWRGLYGLEPSQSFLEFGGCEPAAMSTTESLEVALRYALADAHNGTSIGTRAAPSRAFLLRFLVRDFVEDGADISFCSAFPHEKEFLYPPLTLMKPLKEKGVMNTRPCTRHKHKHNIVYGSTTFTIIDVVPHYPGK